MGFWGSVVEGACARAARARSRSVLPISNYAGILLEVVREHDSGCPGARLSITSYELSGSTIQVVREREVALPGISRTAQRLSGST